MSTTGVESKQSSSASQSRTRSPSSPAPSSRNKKSRTTTACLPCQKRKSRCDFVTRAGCHRCRQLKVACELTVSESEEREVLEKISGVAQGHAAGPSGGAVPGLLAGTSRVHAGTYAQDLGWNNGFTRHPDTYTSYDSNKHAGPSSTLVPPSHIAPPLPGFQHRSSVSTGPSSADDPLVEITNRMSRMESMLSSLVSSSKTSPPATSPSPQSIPALSDPHLEVERGEEAVRLDLESFEARNGHVKGGWTSILGCLVSGQTHGYLDVVEKGIVEQKELERIWTIFKPIFVTIYPFEIFLDPSSPLPTHPLLRCAVLYFTWRASPPGTTDLDSNGVKELERLVEYNVGMTSMVEPDEDAILALVVLSQTATRENERFLRVEDPFGAGAAAHRMAIAIGLEESVERSQQEPVDYLGEEWNRPMISRVCLWYAVYHRHLWSTIYTSPTILPKRSEHDSLLSFISPMTAVFMGDRMLVHLTFEAQMFDLVGPIALELRKSRTCRVYDPFTHERLFLGLEAAVEGLERWRRDVSAAKMPSSSALVLASHLLECMVLLKSNLELHMRLPSPLLVQGGQWMARTGSFFLSQVPKAIDRILQDQTDFSRLPARYILLTLPCVMVVARVGGIKASWVPIHPIFASMQQLGQISQLMRAACPAAARLVDIIRVVSSVRHLDEPDGEEVSQQYAQQGHQETFQQQIGNLLQAGNWPTDAAGPDLLRDFAADTYFGYPFDFNFDFDMADVQMAMTAGQGL